MSGDALVWQLTRKFNSKLVIPGNGQKVQFSRDPLNVTNINTQKASGFANSTAVGVTAAKQGVVFHVKNGRRGAKTAITTDYALRQGVRRSAKTVKAELKNYREDLIKPTLARVTRIRATQKKAAAKKN
jgi:large subunit ribosomal protein L28e